MRDPRLLNPRACLPICLLLCLLLSDVCWARSQSPPPQPGGTPASPVQALELQQGYQPLVAALHVHSQFSNGDYTIFELARYAQQRRVDVLGLADSLLTRVRYGIGPLKKLVSRARARPGVLDHGVEDYLSDVEEAQEQFGNVVLLAGVEVAPYYRWEGGLRSGLRLLDFDRHLLVFGLHDPSAIRNLPVIENETWSNTTQEWGLVIGPVLLLLSGLVLLLVRWKREVRLHHFVVRRRRRFSILGIALCVVGSGWFYDQYPFGRLADPYLDRHDPRPYQRVVDYVRERNGLTFWSYPEARVADVIAQGARMVSGGSVDDLWLVDRYRGFEGLYGDRITITEPGAVWDRLIIESLNGGRQTWASVITGIDFHFFKQGGWYELNRGQTVLWARKKDAASVLDALRQGRGYAVFQGKSGPDLTLLDFGLRAGKETAISGETLVAEDPVTLTAVIDWSSPNPDPGSGRLEIVRDGTLIEKAERPFPIRVHLTESLTSGKHYYRLRVKHKSHELLSNPIFCEAR